MTIWYTTVGFGGNPFPISPRRTLEEAEEALSRQMARKGWRAGELMAAHSVRIYGYRTRAAARAADISDSPGRYGCRA